MLGGEDDCFDSFRRAVFVIFKRDLAFGIRFNADDFAAVPGLGKVLQNTVGPINGQRHIVAVKSLFFFGVAEHDALIAGTVAVNTEGNVAGLMMQIIFYFNGLPAETFLVITNAADGIPDGLFYHFRRYVFVAFCFAGDDDLIGGCQSFYGRTGPGIGAKKQIDDGVGNLVANLVRMSFRN